MNSAPERSSDVGQMVGEYQIVRYLAEGAMGTVYEGVHPVIGKRVAIKVVKPEVAKRADALDRFIFEASAVNKIAHPNIIDVFAFGKLEDGRAYFVMEFLEGESLEARLTRDGRLSLGDATPIFSGVADALDAAHAVGIVHRDLKPDNVFLTDERGRLGCRVVDFGIAKLAEADVSMTQTGMVLGTPLYMSPEQCRGQKVDHRADIYAFTILVYRALAGRHPFKAASLGELILKHVTAEPRPPSTLGLPAGLDPIVARGMAKSPEDRYPSLGAIVAEVTRVMQEIDSAAVPTGAATAAIAASEDTAFAQPPVGADDRPPLGVSRGPASSSASEPESGPPELPVEASTTHEEVLGLTGAAGDPVGGEATVALDTGTWLQEGGSRSLEGHRGGLHVVAFAPDGERIASAGVDQTVRLWDRLGRPLAALAGHRGAVTKIAFSADGNWLASGGEDRAVRVCGVADRSCVHTLRGHEGEINDLVFAPSGDQLYSSGRDRTVRVWDLGTGEGRALKGHRRGGRAIALSPDGGAVASVGAAGTVNLVDARGTAARVLEGLTGTVQTVAFSPSGRHLAACDSNGAIGEWDVQASLERGHLRGRCFSGHKGTVYDLAFSPDGELLASAGADGDVRLWWLETGTRVALKGHRGKVRRVAFTPDGLFLLSSGLDSTVRVWQLSDRSCVDTFKLSGPVKASSVSPDSRFVVSCSASSPIAQLTVLPSAVVPASIEAEPEPAGANRTGTPPPNQAESGVDRVLRMFGVRKD